jgi:DNA-binding XRE family transcriptional regulator
MDSTLKLDEHRLFVYHEGRKRRIFVGELIYIKQKDHYEFIYDKHYVQSKHAIAVGADLDLFQMRHQSPKGKLFASFKDRIPLKENPAYVDYCKAQGISPEEKNLIILLGFIGKRGPSTFVFEPVYQTKFTRHDISQLRQQLHITQYDFALALDIPKLTLQKIEAGTSTDRNTLKRLQIYFEFPDVALWQLKQTGSKIRTEVRSELINFFMQKKTGNEEVQNHKC